MLFKQHNNKQLHHFHSFFGGESTNLPIPKHEKPKRSRANTFTLHDYFNSLSCFIVVVHFDKSKSALSAGIPLEGKGTIHDFTELSKQLSHVLLLSAEGKVANKNAHVLRGPGTKKWTKWAWNIAIGP